MNSNKQAVEAASFERIAEFLHSIGWRDNCDAQWTRLRDAIPELRELLGSAELARPLEVAASVTDAEILEVCGDFAKDAIGKTNLLLIGQRLIALAASRSPVALGAVPVEWQFRWFSTSGQSWGEWSPIDLRGQSIESRVAELNSYRYDGKQIYETRSLYTAPTAQAEQPAPAKCCDKTVERRCDGCPHTTQPAPAVVGPVAEASITLDFKMATELLEMFGGEPCEITLQNGDGHSGKGIYTYYTDLPEEGAEFLGVSDDEALPVLMDAWADPAHTPQPQQIAEPASEPMLRFCPECGSVGPVPEKFRDCCPDGNDSRVIPASLANKCHSLFQLALAVAITPKEPS